MYNEQGVCYNGFINHNGFAVRMKPLISGGGAGSVGALADR
jgi:hypothetical protein